MGRILEAKVVISGEDKTGGAFAAVKRHADDLARKMGGLSAATKAAGKAATLPVAQVTRGVAAVDKLSTSLHGLSAATKASAVASKAWGATGVVPIEASRLLKQLDTLKRTASAVTDFREASRGLGQAHIGMRRSHQEVRRLGAELATARSRLAEFDGVRTFSRGGGIAKEMEAARKRARHLEEEHRRAVDRAETATAQFRDQGVRVRDLRGGLTTAGVRLDRLRAEEERLARAISSTNGLLSHQASLLAGGSPGVSSRVRSWRAADLEARAAAVAASRAAPVRDRRGARVNEGDGLDAGVGGLLAGGLGLGPAAAGFLVYQGAKEAYRAQAKNTHERVRMSVSGMSGDDVEHAGQEAARLSGTYRAFNTTEIMHMLRNAQSVVGSFEEAKHIMEPMLQLRTVALGANPNNAGELEADFDKLIKGMEIKGVTQDMPKFLHYMNGMAKAVNVFGDTLRPTEYYEMFKYGRQATTNLSDKFTLSTAPTLAQELGGSSTGTALSTLYGTLVGGKIKDVAANELDKYGLINRDKVRKLNKTGQIMGLHPGGVKGAELAASDPYAWVNDVFLPALKEKGVTDHNKIQEIIATVFRDRTAAQMVSIFATQQSRIQKDWALVERAKGLDAHQDFMSKDPLVAWQGVKSQLESAFTALGGFEKSAAALNYASQALARVTAEWNRRNEAAKHPGDPRFKGGPALEPQNLDKLNSLLGRPTAGVLAVTNPDIAEAVKAKVDRDRIDARRGEIGRQRDAEQARIDQMDEVERIGGAMAIIGRGERQRQRAAAAKRVAELDAQRQGLDAAVAAHDETVQNLGDVKAARRTLSTMRFGQAGAGSMQGVGAAPSPVGAFGLGGPVAPAGMATYGMGAAPVREPVLPPERSDALKAPSTVHDLGELLNGKVEAKVVPDQIQANVKPDQITAKLEGQADVRVTVTVDGPGRVTDMSSSSSGNVVGSAAFRAGARGMPHAVAPPGGNPRPPGGA